MNEVKAKSESIARLPYPNPSGLDPVGRAVLLLPYEPEIASAMIVVPATVRERTVMVETRAIVVAVGPQAWFEEREPRARPGDKVLISMYCGAILVGPADDITYRMVNDQDIYCRITHEKAKVE